MPGARARACGRGLRPALALRFLRSERDDLRLGHRQQYGLGHRHLRRHMPAVGDRAGTDGLRLAVVGLAPVVLALVVALRDLFAFALLALVVRLVAFGLG